MAGLREWGATALKSGDLYPSFGMGQRPWLREGGRRMSRRVGMMGTRCVRLAGVGLPVAVWPATHLLHTPACRSTSFCPEVLLSSAGGGGEERRGRLAHACIHACIHARTRARTGQPWRCFFPLAYLVEWPWKTKQVLSTFDFSAFKLILSAQLLKQLSSPAVSNFRLGTFTGCQVLSLHCESLAPFLSKRYSNNLYFFLKGTCIALFLYRTLFIIYWNNNIMKPCIVMPGFGIKS